MAFTAEQMANSRKARMATAAAGRAARIERGAITRWDAKWLRDHGQTIPAGVHVVRHMLKREPTPVKSDLAEAVKKPGPVTFAPRQPQVFGLSETPRRVTPGEVDELLIWGLPHFAVCFPDATRDNIRPMLMIACNGPPVHFVRTKHAVGLFALEKTPWNPLGTVHKVFVVAMQHAPAEVLAIYEDGLGWAKACGAKWYHYEECDGYPIAPIAERIGHDATRITYSKRLK